MAAVKARTAETGIGTEGMTARGAAPTADVNVVDLPGRPGSLRSSKRHCAAQPPGNRSAAPSRPLWSRPTAGRSFQPTP
jgi:hypothetical protein